MHEREHFAPGFDCSRFFRITDEFEGKIAVECGIGLLEAIVFARKSGFGTQICSVEEVGNLEDIWSRFGVLGGIFLGTKYNRLYLIRSEISSICPMRAC